MRKIIGVLFITSSLLLGYSAWPIIKVYYSEYVFAIEWADSWKSRLKNPTDLKLPKQWGDIQSITTYPTHWKHTFWMKWVKLPIVTHPNGKFHLDILMMSWIEKDGQRFVVLQYNLREVEGQQNTIWEGGQTFPRVPRKS